MAATGDTPTGRRTVVTLMAALATTLLSLWSLGLSLRDVADIKVPTSGSGPWLDPLQPDLTRAVIFILLTVALVAVGLRQHLRAMREQEAMLHQLADSEARFRLLAENSTDIITRLGSDGRVRYVSPAVRVLLGYDPDEVVGSDPESRCHPDDAPRLATVRQCLMQGERDMVLSYRIRRTDGRYVWMESSCHAVKDGPSGREIIITTRNIEERQRIEAALRTARDAQMRYAGLLEAVIEGVPDAILLIDSHQRITIANPAACQIFGFAETELVGADASRLGAEYIPNPAAERDGLAFVCRYVRRNGESFLGDTVVRPLYDHSRAMGTLKIVRDISDAVAAARSVHTARDSAERANSAKTRFLAAASHDLRQPLHAVGLLVDSLARRVRGQEETGLIDDVQKSLASLEEMFGHLLDMSRLDAGVVPPEVVDMPIMRVLDRVARQARPMAREKGLRLRVVPCRQVVRSDPMLLERILRNLVINAIRYTEDGGIVVGCRRRRTAAGDSLSLEIWDSGRGISANQIDAIFLEFYRVKDRQRGDRQGLGLGLTIVKRLCRLLGHPVAVASHPGRGSVFRVTLPVGSEDAVAAIDHEALLATGDLKGTVVALLDDDAAVLRSTARLLEDWGCQVIAATTLPDLLDRLGDGPALDLLIADYQLAPDLTGLEAVARLRARFGHTLPAVIVTADTDPALVGQARRQTCKLLHKPLRPSRLRSMLALLRHPLPDAGA